MCHEGVCPIGSTFIYSLKACGGMGDIRKVSEVHALIVGTCLLQENDFIGSTLVDMYATCGMLREAQDVFDRLPVQNLVSWTALLSGYVGQSLGQEAIHYFERMQDEGLIASDAVLLACILGACIIIGNLPDGQRIHAEIMQKGLETNVVVANTMVDMYAKCGLLLDAQKIFDEVQEKTVVSWTSLINGYIKLGFYEESLESFHQMQEEGNYMDSSAFICSIKACSILVDIHKGQRVHGDITRLGFLEIDNCGIMGSSLLNMYVKCGHICEAQHVFDNILIQDVVSWTTLIGGYAENGHYSKEVLNHLNHMQRVSMDINSITLAYGLKSCATVGATTKGYVIHADVVRKGSDEDLHVSGILVDMYAKCGLLLEAENVFHNLSCKNVISWT